MSQIAPAVAYRVQTSRIAYICDALNASGRIEAVFGTKHMGPFTADIVRHHPHWSFDHIIMPIESAAAGGHCEIITNTINSRPHANGLVTNQPGVVLVGYGADCPGVLAASHDERVIGMFHAAWWAQADDGIKHLVDGFAAFGVRPDQIKATIGPCIAAENYVVRPDDHFVATLQRKQPSMLRFLDNTTFCFDTRASTEALLHEQGVQTVRHIVQDTYATRDDAGETLFYSARRGRPVNHNNPWAIHMR
jgi:copper oxidase (laccase) domain-containing protein